MDCNMPVLDGYKACQKLKDLMFQKKILRSKIIACTADITKENIEKCRLCFFDDVVIKPLSKDILIKLLKKNFIRKELFNEKD